jgi:serine/threonine protein kinase
LIKKILQKLKCNFYLNIKIFNFLKNKRDFLIKIIKNINKSSTPRNNNLLDIKKNREYINYINSENIAPIFDLNIFTYNGIKFLFYIMPLFANGNLKEFINKCNLKWIGEEIIENFLLFCFQIFKSLELVHTLKIGHGDLKMENFFVLEKEDQLLLSLGDFGASSFSNEKIINTKKNPVCSNIKSDIGN